MAEVMYLASNVAVERYCEASSTTVLSFFEASKNALRASQRGLATHPNDHHPQGQTREDKRTGSVKVSQEPS